MKATKQKRTKYVYSNSSAVAHIWASQSQDSARVGGRGNCFFSGESIYSYGRHYETGRLVRINGQQVALINRSGYSSTTGKHINEAASATCHMLQVNVTHSFDWYEGLVTMQGELVDELFDTLNQRKFWIGARNLWEPREEYGIAARVQKFNELAKALGKSQLQLVPDAGTLALLQAHIDARIARQAEIDAHKLTPEYLAKQERARIAKQNALAAKSAAEIDAWKLGLAPATAAVRQIRPHILRVIQRDGTDVVQTNTSAEVPLFIVKRALLKLENGGLKKGTKIGPYEFTSFKKGTVTVGCHEFELNAVKQILSK